MAETEEKFVNAAPVQEEKMEQPVEIKLPELLYTKETLAAMRSFFKGRSKNPELYTYTSAGDLEIKEGDQGKGKKKAVAGTVLLNRFVPLDPGERALLEETRLKELAAIDEEYEAEAIVLKAAWEEYENTLAMRAVLNSNQRLTEIDARRNAVRSQVRDCIPIPNPKIKEILLSERYEERRMFPPADPFEQNVVRICYYPFPTEVEMGKYIPTTESAEGEKKEEAAEDAVPYRQRLKDGRYARIFYDASSDANGFLSPMSLVDFTIEVGGIESRYSSPIQAYQVERVRELGYPSIAANLMKTRSARTILLLVKQVKGHPNDAKGLWLKIYTSVYNKFPNLAAKLLATGSDTLIFADTREGPSAVGLGEKDPAVLDPAKWKGENAVGIAQETVRTRLREDTLKEDPQAENVDAAVITEEEQEAAKLGAIINAKRGGWRKS